MPLGVMGAGENIVSATLKVLNGHQKRSEMRVSSSKYVLCSIR